jgi:hypothetical protein
MYRSMRGAGCPFGRIGTRLGYFSQDCTTADPELISDNRRHHPKSQEKQPVRKRRHVGQVEGEPDLLPENAG